MTYLIFGHNYPQKNEDEKVDDADEIEFEIEDDDGEETKMNEDVEEETKTNEDEDGEDYDSTDEQRNKIKSRYNLENIKLPEKNKAHMLFKNEEKAQAPLHSIRRH